MLLGCSVGSSRAINRGPRLRVVDHCQHLAALDAVSFVGADLYDVSHRLAGEFAGLRGMYRPHSFQKIRDIGSLHLKHGNMAYGFRRRGGLLPLAGAAAETAHCG